MKNFDRQKIMNILMRASSLLLMLAVCLALSPRASALEDPDIQSASSILFDVGTGRVLYEKNANERRAPASLTKIMTAMLALEACDAGSVSLTDVVTVKDGMYFDISADGSSVGLSTDEELTLEQLLYCALVASANEACNVIATHVSGDISEFVALMNRRASELGCRDTHFANTHGMPNDDHYTTASDLLTIVRAALENDVFRRIVSTANYTVPATNKSNARKLSSTNNLLHTDSYGYYEYATGIKTGSTDAAGYCLAASASKDGRELITIVLGAQSTVGDDGRTQLMSFTETRRLMEWGFNNFAYQTLLGTTDLVAEIPVELGRGVSSVVLRPAEEVTALLPVDINMDDVVLERELFNNDTPLTAPVEQNTILGRVTVFYNSEEYGTVNLVANSAVELDRPAYISQEIGKALTNKYVRIAITAVAALLVLYIAFIVYYNVNRARRKAVARDLARRRVEEYNSTRDTTTSKSFEEIESMHRKMEEMGRRK